MTTDVLVVAPFVLKHESPHAHADGCTFDVASDFTVTASYTDVSGTSRPLTMTSSADGHSASGTLPTSPRPLKVTITVTPKRADAAKHHEISGDIQYDGNGLWSAIATTPIHFHRPSSLSRPSSSVTAFLNVWLPRVKDVTDEVIEHLKMVPPNRQGTTPPSTWTVPAATAHFCASTPVDTSGKLVLEGPTTVDPNTIDRVFEIKGFKTPRLISMSWPRAMGFPMGKATPNATFLQAGPAPYLIFFHAQHGQNMPQFYTNGPWPYGWDFLFFGLFRYLVYQGDVLHEVFSKGLPIQVRKASKNCVVLVPQNKYGPRGPADEIIEFNDPELVQETLEEIQVHMYFRADKKFARPNLGRVAAGSMSNGNVLLTQFLSAHPSKFFLRNVLREVYIFDPNGDDDAQNAMPVNAALSWARFGPPDKMIRYYAQNLHPAHHQLLGGKPPSGNFVVDGKNPNFTGGVISATAWFEAGAPKPAHHENNWQVAHQLIPGMLLTHAFTKSGF